MSSPSPDTQKAADRAYQPSEPGDHHGLSGHHHACQCNEKPPDTPKTDTLHNCLLSKQAHHNAISLNNAGLVHHPINQSVHVHVHAAPKTAQSKAAACTCHPNMQEENANESAESGDSNDIAILMAGRKLEADDRIEVSPLPPALPPRPPPRPRADGNPRTRNSPNPNHGGIRKYVFWCCVCGGLATILGALFLAVYFLLRSYTSTLGYFETIPTFVPATMLILTGLCVISLARRKNRYSYLIKVCGLCCLVCALTCVLVTITTTVIHMNRLQTLRECVYTQKTRTCTCYSVPLESHHVTDDGMRFVFDSTPDCEVIHGALYSCLRAMFGLSVSGILVCIFSCMLVYQLLSHEKKKMYWEQLELRCRSFYQQHTGGGAISNHGSVRGPPMISQGTYCSCCEECRYPPMPLGPQVYPWDHPTDRFWTPGRVGNFYSPNPGEDNCGEGNRERTTTTGWNWRRLPWTRSNQSDNQRDDSLTYQAGAGSADSQYGFSNNRPGDSSLHEGGNTGSTGSYSVLDNTRPPIGGVYVWGPPPPYSNPNSPARRLQQRQSPGRHHPHHHLHAHESHCQMATSTEDCRNSRRTPRQIPKDNYENTGEIDREASADNGESTDSDRVVPHAPPARKAKKPKSDEGEDASTKAKAECVRFLPRLQGVENAAFQNQESAERKPETSESEVYFADVSSCCNVSVRNSSIYDEALGGGAGDGSPAQTPPTETTDDGATPPAFAADRQFDRFLAPDAQYEVIRERRTSPSNLTNTISGLHDYYATRRGLGTNISALIQNLGGNAAGLLYGGDEEEARGHGCHSDGTMDSGWHSGSEKNDAKKTTPDGNGDPVNV